MLTHLATARGRNPGILVACAWASLAAQSAFAQRPLGLDVSHYNGTITPAAWTQVHNSGRVFAFTKASEGADGTYNDSTFAANMVNGRAAGMLMGGYHFGRPEFNAAVDEANQFVSVAGPYITGGYLRPVLDLESGGVGTPAGRTYLSNWVNDWMNAVQQQTGVEPIIYCNTNYAQNYLNSTVAARTLWIANWPASPDPQNGSPPTGVWPDWSFWQYGGGTLPGISGGVDLDVFNGTLAQLQNFVIPSGCAYPDDYPYPTQNPLSADPWLFFYRECTSYVAWRMNRDHGTTSPPYYFSNYMLGGHWGNAENWQANAIAVGFPVGNMPSVGAIAHYNATESPTVGHLAYVEKVNADGTVDVSEYNFGCSHCYGTRCNIRPPRFITIHGTPPPPKFSLGDTVEVSGVSPDTLTVRSPNACDPGIAQKAEGNRGVIIAPDSVRCGSTLFYNRWRIQWTDGVIGWSAEDWLIKVNVPPAIPGDFNGDGHVDETDFTHMKACRADDAVRPPPAGCFDADLDHDADIDQTDFGLFQRCLTGPAVIGNFDCAN